MFRKHFTVTLEIEERTPVSFNLEDKYTLAKNKIIQKEFWKSINEIVNGDFKNKNKAITQAVFNISSVEKKK